MNSSKYRKRFKRIIILMLLASVLVFSISILPTIRLGKELKKNSTEQLSDSRYAQEYETLQQQQKQVNHYFAEDVMNSTIDDELFAIASRTCDTSGVYLSSYPPVHTTSDKGYTLLTQEIVVYGEYLDLVRYIQAMERDKRFFTHAASFLRETDRKTAINRLSLKLYIQSILN